MKRTMGILTWTVLVPIVLVLVLNVMTALIAWWESQQAAQPLYPRSAIFWLVSHIVGLLGWFLVMVLSVVGLLPGTRFEQPKYWLCQRCGYNMRTVSGPICPECGTKHAIKQQKDR